MRLKMLSSPFFSRTSIVMLVVAFCLNLMTFSLNCCFYMSAIPFHVQVNRTLLSDGGDSHTAATESPSSSAFSTQSTHEEREGRMAQVLTESGFIFSRSTSEFLLEAAYATKRRGSSSSLEKDVLLYEPHELEMIVRALHTSRGFTNVRLWSGSDAITHFIGTGSCLVKLKRPASEVAIGLIHAIYLQQWKVRVTVRKESVCDYRFRMAQVLGSSLEHKLWHYSGFFSNGPWSSCMTTFVAALRQNEQSKNQSISQNPTLVEFSRDLPLHMLLCDEIEEALGGDAILSGHWKRRSVEFFDNLRMLASHTGDNIFVNWIDKAQAMSHVLHQNNPKQKFKELTPPNPLVLFQHQDLRLTNLNSTDSARWKTLIQFSLRDRPMLPAGFQPSARVELLQEVDLSRDICDAFVAGNMTMEEYLESYLAMKNRLDYCELSDQRFQQPFPLPDRVPKWAKSHPLWSPHGTVP